MVRTPVSPFSVPLTTAGLPPCSSTQRRISSWSVVVLVVLCVSLAMPQFLGRGFVHTSEEHHRSSRRQRAPGSTRRVALAVRLNVGGGLGLGLGRRPVA